MRFVSCTPVLFGCLLSASSLNLLAQQLPDDRYVNPPPAIQEMFERDKNYATLDSASPDGELFLIPHYRELSTLEQMSRPTLRLAMLELRSEVDREWRLDTFGFDGLEVYSLASRQRTKVALPANSLISDMMWSPDGAKIAFLVHAKDGSRVWVADAHSGQAAPISDRKVMATLATSRRFGRPRPRPSRMLQWTPDGGVLALLVPTNRGPRPTAPRVAPAPIVRRTRDKATPTSTYPFLLKTEYDRELFRYHTTAQLALLRTGQAPAELGEPGMYEEFSLSADGSFILTERIADPLSFLTRYSSFAKTLEVAAINGGSIAVIRETPLLEGSTRRGGNPARDLPRDVVWAPSGAALSFLWREPGPKDQGDAPSNTSPRKNRLMRLGAPFDVAQATEVLSSEDSLSNIIHSRDGRYVFATVAGSRSSDFNGKRKLVAWDTHNGMQAYPLVSPWDPADPLADPGQIWTQSSGNGLEWALQPSDGSAVYLKGAGYRDDFRPRPFIDQVAIQDGASERRFESSVDYFDQPLVALDGDLEQIVVSRESATVFPDSFLKTSGGTFDNLTRNVDPFPEITSARRVDFEFKRRDGLTIQAKISLPVGYQPGSRVPAMFWTYPREYASEKAYKSAAIRSRNQKAYTPLSYLRWSDLWLTQGYALVYPDVPIIGPGDTFNNNFISNLSDTLYAAIRKTDQLGLVDPDRAGHGGHSYGAFATANLLANTPYFRAGIAGDGAYNRTLTPMAFQGERRYIWEAQDIYLEMSPFFKADHIDTPLLMYHGADDNNTGTFPIQSDRMMQVLTGLGKTAVLYKYPYESHGPSSRETYLDLWARFIEWFDRHVKDPPKSADAEPTGSRPQ